MINFIKGKISLGEKNILAISNGELNELVKESLVKKRKDAVGNYYYMEAELDDMRFGVFISLQETRIDWLRLSWLDSPVKGWDDASEEAMKDEYRLLSNFVEKNVGRPPDNKRNRRRAWHFTWGELEVSYEPRAYQADICMKPGKTFRQ